MTDADLQNYLRDNGYPEPIVRDGRAGLIARWRAFVEQAEKGYAFGLEDYRNDLDIRAIIQLAQIDDPQVDALDARFQALLIATNVRVWESAPDAPWDFGYPRNAGPELLDGLREEGLVT
jgi:hypothetical protein